MSRIVPTEIGRFRQVTNGIRNWFLYECPTCLEWLPVSEEILNGTAPVDHVNREGLVCLDGGIKKLGSFLVATMQARILTEQKPYTENESERWPS